MNKIKLKLNSLYGQMVAAKPITNAMRICSKRVRCVGCVRCLHYEKCARDGVPASHLGRFLAWLDLVALKPIAADIRKYCVKGLKLEAHEPTAGEEVKGYYATICGYTETKPKKLLFRVGLQGNEDAETLYSLVFNAYVKYGARANVKGKGKKKKVRKNGKITKA